MSNTGFLEGLACPACGQSSTLQIAAECTILLTDSDIVQEGGFEWDRESECICPACGYKNSVEKFDVSNLE
jgi:Zn ribbon nucleic-acid-binding protein